LLYFICASVANTLPVAFMGLALNPAMDVVSTMASACVTTIVSCRAVQRLSTWGTSNAPTQDSAFKMSPTHRSGRSDSRKPTSVEGNGVEHIRKPWGKRQYYPSEGDVQLSSAMFARTVYMDNERRDPGNRAQYEGQQKNHSDGGVFSLQADDQSLASSPTMPVAWKQTPSIRSGSTQATGNDKDKVPYRPTTARLSELSEQGTYTAKPVSLYQTSESIEEDERGSEDTPSHLPGQPSPTVPLPGAGELNPAEGGTGFGSGDLKSDGERQQQSRQWHAR